MLVISVDKDVNILLMGLCLSLLFLLSLMLALRYTVGAGMFLVLYILPQIVK